MISNTNCQVFTWDKLVLAGYKLVMRDLALPGQSDLGGPLDGTTTQDKVVMLGLPPTTEWSCWSHPRQSGLAGATHDRVVLLGPPRTEWSCWSHPRQSGLAGATHDRVVLLGSLTTEWSCWGHPQQSGLAEQSSLAGATHDRVVLLGSLTTE